MREWDSWGEIISSASFYDRRFETTFDPQHPGVSIAIYQTKMGETLNEWLERHATTKTFGETQSASLLFFKVTEPQQISIKNYPSLQFADEIMGIKEYITVIKQDLYVIIISCTNAEDDKLRTRLLQRHNVRCWRT